MNLAFLAYILIWLGVASIQISLALSFLIYLLRALIAYLDEPGEAL